MEKMIEEQIESLKDEIKWISSNKVRADELSHMYALLTGKLIAYEDILEVIKYIKSKELK
jgi:hypothetical protein